MMMDVRLLEATLDEIQAVLDAEKNAGIVGAVREALLAPGDAQGFVDKVVEILGEGYE
jgi:hypothetical protein